MDLRSWILDDLDLVVARARGGVLNVVPAERWAEQTGEGGSSITFLLWHVARHHDIAVNSVIRQSSLVAENHAALTDQLGPSIGLAEAEPVGLAQTLDPEAVAAYYEDVYASTKAWIKDADLSALDDTADSASGLDRVGVSRDDVPWLYNMWEAKPASFFVRWEAIGHGINHLGDLTSVRNRMGLSPF